MLEENIQIEKILKTIYRIDMLYELLTCINEEYKNAKFLSELKNRYTNQPIMTDEQKEEFINNKKKVLDERIELVMKRLKELQNLD